MNIARSREGSDVILAVEGRVDTITGPRLQEELLQTLQTEKRVVLDFAKVDYLSSAGLRVLVVGQKTAMSKKAELTLANPSPFVKSVLDSVGFAKVLTIK